MAKWPTYQINQLVRLYTSQPFQDDEGNPADPDDVECRVLSPDGNITNYTYIGNQIIKEGTGIYHLDITPDQEGRWDFYWRGLGIVQAVDASAFVILESPFF